MAFHTIKLKKYLDIIEERKAHEAITPGMLLDLNSDNEFQKHAVPGGTVKPPIFALEDELQGKGITEAYAVGDRVQGWVAQRGDQVYGLLADGEKVVIGDYLSSNGDGYLKKLDGDSVEGEIVARALEAVDRSSSSGADTNTTGRIAVLIV